MTIRVFFDNSTIGQSGRIAQRFFRKGSLCGKTYAELRANVLRLASAIRVRGIKPGQDNVALILENCPEWPEIYLALACIGVTAVPVDPKLRPREMAFILGDSGAKAVFCGAKLAATMAELKNGLPALSLCITVGGDETGSQNADKPTALETISLPQFLDGAGTEPGFDGLPKPDEDTVASLIYTSGTTGTPKGVILTHGNFASDTLAAVVPVKFCKEDNFLAVLPFFHTYSFTGNILLPLCQGGCMSFVRSIKTIGEDMKALRPTILMAVPLLAEKIYAKIEKGIRSNPLARLLVAIGLGKLVGRKVVKGFGGALRFIAIGGAPADAKVISGLVKIGISTLEGYGLTECSPLVCYPTPETFKIGTVGKVLPCMESKLEDCDSTGAGELCVKGPNVMKGYYNNPEATAKAFDSDGFLHTGDLARIDAEGNVTICGRRKAMIVNREGKNIYPEEIEQLISRSPLVAESLALGYKVGDENGERVGLIVQPDEEKCAATGEPKSRWDVLVSREIERICKLGLAAYKIPRKIVVRHLPFELTSTMKVRRVKYNGSLDEK